MFEIRLPSAMLRPFVDCYWFLKRLPRPHPQLDELLFTDARADLVLTFGSPLVRVRADRLEAAEPIHTSYIDAQRRYPVRVRRTADTDLIWVRFRSGGLAALIDAPAHELSGRVLRLIDVFGRPAVILEEQLAAFSGRPTIQAALLDAFFLSRIAIPREYRHTMHLIQLIERRRGVISVAELSRASGASVRTVDRLFQRIVGLPPKLVARAVRFRHVHDALVAQPEIRWADIVAELDYFDESHLAKDILSLTGVGPQAYRAFLTLKQKACLDALSRFYMTRRRHRA